MMKKPIPVTISKINPKLIEEGFQLYLKKALQFLILYAYDVNKLCMVYGFEDEIDMLVGNEGDDPMAHHSLVPEYPKFVKKLNNSHVYVNILCNNYKKIFDKLIKKQPKDEFAIASAWYLASLYQIWDQHEKLKPLFAEHSALLKNVKRVCTKPLYGYAWVSAYDSLKKLIEKNKERV